MKNKRYKIIVIWSIAILVLFFAFYSTQKSLPAREPSLEKTEIPIESISVNSVKKTISITIIAENETLHLEPQAGVSLYDALVLAKDAEQIIFSGKNYSGLGFFVTDIGSLHSGNGKNLFYYINNKEASVGVSSYLLKDGDIIEWKLK